MRTIASNEALIVSSNRQPIRLKTTLYFENWTFKRQVKKGACTLRGASQDEILDKVRLMFRNFFSKIREKAYQFVDREGGFALHFLADFIRGSSTYKEKKAQAHHRPEIPLTVEEKRIYQTLLQRRKGEKQLDYWRRKRAMNNLNDKKSLVQEVIGIQKRQKNLVNSEILLLLKNKSIA